MIDIACSMSWFIYAVSHKRKNASYKRIVKLKGRKIFSQKDGVIT